MNALSGLALAAPAGFNAYIPLLAVALAQKFGYVHLAAPYDKLGASWLIAVVASLLVVELIADKFPAVDHANDVIQTAIRPAAGGLLAVSSSGSGTVNPAVLVVAGVVVAGGVHTVKASVRPVVNASTAGTGAPVASTFENVAAAVMSVLALVAPVIAMVLAIAAVIAAVWMLRRLHRRLRNRRPIDWSEHAYRGIRHVLGSIRSARSGIGRVLRHRGSPLD